MSEGIQTYEVGIVWYRFWYRSEPIIVSHRRRKRREIYSSKNEMECPASMANHMQKNLGHTLSRVSTLSTGKDRFQDVYRHKARYRFWDWYRFFKENANCSFLKKRERRPLALCSNGFGPEDFRIRKPVTASRPKVGILWGTFFFKVPRPFRSGPFQFLWLLQFLAFQHN